MDAEALVRPVIEGAGLELVDVVSARETGRDVLRVVVDRSGGIGLDELSELSSLVARHLDAEGYDAGPYELEVSSPGLERALTRPSHFHRSVGERVKVRTTASPDGSKTHTGTLVAADDDGVIVAVATGDVRVPYADIASARTVVDWGAELKRSKA